MDKIGRQKYGYDVAMETFKEDVTKQMWGRKQLKVKHNLGTMHDDARSVIFMVWNEQSMLSTLFWSRTFRNIFIQIITILFNWLE